jgi:dolichol-phosphate mannosyltransferase
LTTTRSDSERTAASKSQITIVIPTLNEEASIGHLLKEVKSQGFDNIIVADGYSKDRTAEIASSLGVEVLMQHGQGKAGAMLTAFRAVTTPYLIVMDGDGSYDPSDLNRFVPLMGAFDFVKGVRERNKHMTGLHKFGNSVITKTFDLLFGTFIGDVCSGMYQLRTEMVRNLHLERHPLTVEQEIAAEMLFASATMTTVPINYRERTGGVSKTNTWRQGVRDLITNFDLARTHNPIMLFSVIAASALIPAMVVLSYGAFLFLSSDGYHSGYFDGGLVLLVLGAQGITVATIGTLLKRIDRKLSLLERHAQ